MEVIAFLVYWLLRQWLDLYFDYKKAKLPPQPQPVNTSCIGFDLPPEQEVEE